MLSFVGEVNDFGWAHKCEVKRVEEEKKPLVLKIVQADLLE